MADSKKPALASLQDSVGSGLGKLGGVFADQLGGLNNLAAEGLYKAGSAGLSNLEAFDKSTDTSGTDATKFTNPSDTLQSYENGAKVNSLLNAQNPVPMPYTTTASDPIDQLNLNAEAIKQGTPLDLQQAAAHLSGTGAIPIPDNLKGTGASIANPSSQIDTDAIATAGSLPPTAGPGLVNPLAGSQAMAFSSITDAERAGKANAIATHSYNEERIRLETEDAAKQQLMQDKFELKYQEQMDDFTSSIKDLKELAGQKVVPGAFLARQDTSASLATGISVALGALAGGLNGTNQNIGLDMINKAIDRDVAAQQFNLDTQFRIKSADVGNQKNLLSMMQEKFKDDKSAVLATKLAMLSMAQDTMNSKLSEQGGAMNLQTQASAKAARSAIMEKREILEHQLKASLQQQAQLSEMLKGKDKNNLGPEEALAFYGPERAAQYVSGFGPARSIKDKEKFQELYGDSKNSLDSLKSILGSDINKFSPTQRAELATELTLLTGKMRIAVLGPGAMTKEEYDRLITTLGDPTAIFALPGVERAKMQKTYENLQRAEDNAVKLYFGRDKFNELKASRVSNLVRPLK